MTCCIQISVGIHLQFYLAPNIPVLPKLQSYQRYEYSGTYFFLSGERKLISYVCLTGGMIKHVSTDCVANTYVPTKVLRTLDTLRCRRSNIYALYR